MVTWELHKSAVTVYYSGLSRQIRHSDYCFFFFFRFTSLNKTIKKDKNNYFFRNRTYVCSWRAVSKSYCFKTFILLINASVVSSSGSANFSEADLGNFSRLTYNLAWRISSQESHSQWRRSLVFRWIDANGCTDWLEIELSFLNHVCFLTF